MSFFVAVGAGCRNLRCGSSALSCSCLSVYARECKILLQKIASGTMHIPVYSRRL
jgi:hypothetical protein